MIKKIALLLVNIIMPGMASLVTARNIVRGFVLLAVYSVCVQFTLAGFFLWSDSLMGTLRYVSLILAAGIVAYSTFETVMALFFTDWEKKTRSSHEVLKDTLKKYLEEHHNEALATIDTLLKELNDYPDGYFYKAVILERENRLPEAFQAYRRCRYLDSSNKWEWQTRDKIISLRNRLTSG